MWCKKATSMIIGISIDQEICPTPGQVSQIHLTEGKSSRRNFVVRGEIDETASNIKAWSFGAWNLEKYVKEGENKGQAKLGKWKTEGRKCPKLDMNLIKLTLRIWNSRRSSWMLGKSWKSQPHLLCRVKRHTAGTVQPVARMMITGRDFHVLRKPRMKEYAYGRNCT